MTNILTDSGKLAIIKYITTYRDLIDSPSNTKPLNTLCVEILSSGDSERIAKLEVFLKVKKEVDVFMDIV